MRFVRVLTPRSRYTGRHSNAPKCSDIGFIAQEVEEIYPELVSTGGDGYKRVDYSALTPILVEAIKAQQRKIETEQRRIDDLTERLESLEAARP